MKGRDSIMFSCLSAILVFCVVIQPIDAQGDLSGQDMAEDESSQDMMEHDPNILNPINQEGYGRNIPTTVNDNSAQSESKKTASEKNNPSQKSVGAQTIDAALQLGVLVAVGLMVVGLFMIIVAVEVFCKMVQEHLNCDREKKIDLENQDPAALVGTFKRYK